MGDVKLFLERITKYILLLQCNILLGKTCLYESVFILQSKIFGDCYWINMMAKIFAVLCGNKVIQNILN